MLQRAGVINTDHVIIVIQTLTYFAKFRSNFASKKLRRYHDGLHSNVFCFGTFLLVECKSSAHLKAYTDKNEAKTFESRSRSMESFIVNTDY